MTAVAIVAFTGIFLCASLEINSELSAIRKELEKLRKGDKS